MGSHPMGSIEGWPYGHIDVTDYDSEEEVAGNTDDDDEDADDDGIHPMGILSGWYRCTMCDKVEPNFDFVDVDNQYELMMLCLRCFDNLRFHLMGSLSGWYQCGWCDWWVWVQEGVPEGDIDPKYDFVSRIFFVGPHPRQYRLMLRCTRCADCEEPPWRPNNRDRCAEHLQLWFGKWGPTKLPLEVRRVIAEFIADNER